MRDARECSMPSSTPDSCVAGLTALIAAPAEAARSDLCSALSPNEKPSAYRPHEPRVSKRYEPTGSSVQTLRPSSGLNVGEVRFSLNHIVAARPVLSDR
jgi:hypothetical protein